jgi:hypothetical protein
MQAFMHSSITITASAPAPAQTSATFVKQQTALKFTSTKE